MKNKVAVFSLISVIIPARNEAMRIATVVSSVIKQCPADSRIEVIVIDDGSSDDTKQQAEAAGATVLSMSDSAQGGNPAIARNRGAAVSKGDPIIFLDADCIPEDNWLALLLKGHAQGFMVVGGSLALPPGLSFSARCDYYCGWYHTHPKRPAGIVSQHPPCNVSVRREAFMNTCGFVERQPIAYAHEELAWQAQLQSRGEQIYFESKAIVAHYNRPGFANLLRRSYRWGYSAIEAKAGVAITRFSRLYRHPWLVILLSLPLAFASTLYIPYCWLRAGMFEPLLMLPALLTARLAYAFGMLIGGFRCVLYPPGANSEHRPRWE
jgi:glycosyltransferase involved in cell wall biosynthesis